MVRAGAATGTRGRKRDSWPARSQGWTPRPSLSSWRPSCPSRNRARRSRRLRSNTRLSTSPRLRTIPRLTNNPSRTIRSLRVGTDPHSPFKPLALLPPPARSSTIPNIHSLSRSFIKRLSTPPSPPPSSPLPPPLPISTHPTPQPTIRHLLRRCNRFSSTTRLRRSTFTNSSYNPSLRLRRSSPAGFRFRSRRTPSLLNSNTAMARQGPGASAATCACAEGVRREGATRRRRIPMIGERTRFVETFGSLEAALMSSCPQFMFSPLMSPALTSHSIYSQASSLPPSGSCAPINHQSMNPAEFFSPLSSPAITPQNFQPPDYQGRNSLQGLVDQTKALAFDATTINALQQHGSPHALYGVNPGRSPRMVATGDAGVGTAAGSGRRGAGSKKSRPSPLLKPTPDTALRRKKGPGGPEKIGRAHV